MFEIPGYDSWKLSYPPEWDNERASLDHDPDEDEDDSDLEEEEYEASFEFGAEG